MGVSELARSSHSHVTPVMGFSPCHILQIICLQLTRHRTFELLANSLQLDTQRVKYLACDSLTSQ